MLCSPLHARSDGPRVSPTSLVAVLADPDQMDRGLDPRASQMRCPAPGIGMRGQTFTRTTAAVPSVSAGNRRESTSHCKSPELGQLVWLEDSDLRKKRKKKKREKKKEHREGSFGIGIYDEAMVQHSGVIPSPRFYILTFASYPKSGVALVQSCGIQDQQLATYHRTIMSDTRLRTG